MSGERIQKVLAAQGYGSRRELEKWITAGRVVVNGEVAELGQRVTAADVIEVDGQKLRTPKTQQTEILVLNKSAGVICTHKDPEGRKTIYDDLPKLKQGRWLSVGRLDVQTSGLILLTNDGQLANKLSHPSTGIDREYAVRIDRQLSEEEMSLLQAGVESEGERLAFSDIRYYNGSERNVWYHVVVMEGKNREVRRIFEAIDCQVSRLKRVRFGPVVLPSWLRNGQWASMITDDVAELHRILGLRFQAPKRAHGKASKVARTSCLLPYPKLVD